MKRQKSILSFLQRPPTVSKNEIPVGGGDPKGHAVVVSEEKLRHRNSAASNLPAVLSSTVGVSDEIRGIDTPPEKEQHPFFPLKAIASGENDESNRSGHSMFASIKHKFVKPNSAEKPCDRNLSDGRHDDIYNTSNKYSYSNGRDKESPVSDFPIMKNVFFVEKTACQGDKRHPLLVETDGDITGPETPGTLPVVPCLKRVQEDGCNFGATNTTHSSMDNSKRVKFSHDLGAEKRKDEVATEMASKFDWLHPSRIKDANGRRPGNPLYDKRTLYIPPDVLRNMSASQKQ